MYQLPTSVRMVMMSHLSDLQIEISVQNPGKEFYIHTKLNFIKYLLNKYTDTTTEIIPDKEWEAFRKEHVELEAQELKEAKEECINAANEYHKASVEFDKTAGFPIHTPVLVIDELVTKEDLNRYHTTLKILKD